MPSSSLPSVRWERVGVHRCLVVQFEGKLLADEARAKIAAIQAELDDVSEPVHMIWDALAMTAYEGEARTLWQDGLAGLRPRIHAIHLITASSVIRMGASVVGMVLGLDIECWPSREAVEIR